MNKRHIFSKVSISVILVVFILSILNEGCEFESTEVYYLDVEKTEGETPVAELSFVDSVIIIDRATLFEYSLNFLKQEVYQVVFYVDGRKIESKEESTGSVLLQLLPGEHLFEIVVHTSTESGSLADLVRSEVFTYTKSWTIFAEAEDAGQIQIQSVGQVEDSLLIEWERYPGYKFHSYELFKKTSSGDVLLYESFDVNYTSSFDPYFVGGEAIYFIRFHKYSGEQYDSDTISYTSYPGMIDLDLDWEIHNLSIAWPKCDFKSNFGSYQLSQNLNGGPAEIIYTTEGVNDTTLSINVGENQDLQYELTYRSNMPDAARSNNGVYSLGSDNISTGSFYLPKPFPAYEVIAQSKEPPFRIYTPEFFYDVVEDRMIQRELAPHNGLFDASADNHEFISGLSYYRGSGEEWTFFWLDKEISNLPPTIFENEERRACVTGSGVFIIESGSSSYLYSRKGDSVIIHYENDSLHWPVMSQERPFIVATDIENNKIDFYYGFWNYNGDNRFYDVAWMKSLKGTAGNYVFRNETQIAMIAGNQLEIRSVEAMTPEYGSGDGLLLSTETSASRVVETDPISNTLLACSADRLYVYDMTDLRLLGEIPNTTVYQKIIQRGPRQVAYLNSTVFYMDEGATQATSHTLPIEKWR